jgi:hypothetical protein
MFRFLRILTVLIASSTATLAVQYDLKENGLISFWGKVAIGLVIVSGLTSIIVEFLDHFRQKRDERERKREFERLRFQLSKPALPLRLRTVLKYSIRDETIEHFFGEERASFQRIIDQFKSRGKFMHPKLADDFPWDENHQVNEYSLCALEPEQIQVLDQAPSEHQVHLLKPPLMSVVSVYAHANGEENSSPDFEMKTVGTLKAGDSSTVTDLRLYNDNVYLETHMGKWEINENRDSLLSIYDFKGARIKFEFNIQSFDDFDLSENKPYLTSIQFVCGNSPINTINLGLGEIGEPTVEKNNWAKMDRKSEELFGVFITFVYDFIIPTEDFESLVTQQN